MCSYDGCNNATTGMDQGELPLELTRFRAAVLSDAQLQASLVDCKSTDSFVARAMAEAGRRGFSLEEHDLRKAIRPDPIGASRWLDAPPSLVTPPHGWLPVNVLPSRGEFCVDWVYFGDHPLTEPFFEDSLRVAMWLPLNKFARYRTRLADLAHCVAQQAALPPSGFIFHMSRCGSTLASQMLASDPRNVVISEAAPIDTVVRLRVEDTPAAAEAHATLLKAMVGALTQRRRDVQVRSFVKLDSWHTLALPLFRRAFPDVPWVFLYREPSEVLASQMYQRGIQTLPEFLPSSLFGITDDDAQDSDAYCARVLNATCAAVIEPYAAGGGLLVNYRELPSVVWMKILPHFGIEVTADTRERMTATARFNAKEPSMLFSGDDAEKRQLQTDSLRELAEHCIGDVYRRLEMLNAARG